MLTFLALPKAFVGDTAIIQQNAIRSWTLLASPADIVLAGDDHGVADAAAAIGVRYAGGIERSAQGTPLLSALVERIPELVQTELVALVNADIILMSDFVHAVRRVASRYHRFLMVGERRDLDVHAPLTFGPAWEAELRRQTSAAGTLYNGIDYFVFPRALWGRVPPFAIGRMHWDNWFLYEARRRRAIVVDATPVVLAVHQNHPYALGQTGGDEVRRNRELLGGTRHQFTTREVTHVLKPDSVAVRCRSCYPACVCTAEWCRD